MLAKCTGSSRTIKKIGPRTAHIHENPGYSIEQGVGDEPHFTEQLIVGSLGGNEPADLSGTTSPALFALDSRIESVGFSYVNEAAMSKNDEGPATYLPALTPEIFSGNEPGYIELTVTPASGESLSPEQLTYTTSAKFPSNPTSLQLGSSEDGFATTLSTIQLDQERTETTPVTISAGDAPFSFRWVAGKDFGEQGGGAAGFTSNDVVLEGMPP